MDPSARGQMIKRARRRRGYSQSVLAELIGRSESWLSQVERGKLTADSHEVLTRLARVLRIDVSQITGIEPEATSDMDHAITRAIERAMMRYPALEGSNPHTDVEPTVLSARAHHACAVYQAARYDEVGRLLPHLIREADAAAHSPGADRPAMCSARSMVYNTTAAFLRKVGKKDLAWHAADRAISAAEWADQPLLSAIGAYRLAYVLISRKHPSEALELAMRAANTLEIRMRPGTPAQLSVYGGLHLAAATAAAAEFDRSAIPGFLHQAHRVAELLGGEPNLHGTAFGHTNVAIHTISTSVMIGDARTAVETGEELDVSALPAGLIGRRTQVYLELARAYTQRRQDAAAVHTLLDAERIAPQLVHCHTGTVSVLTELLRREHRPSTPGLRPLARRVGVA